MQCRCDNEMFDVGFTGETKNRFDRDANWQIEDRLSNKMIYP